MVIDSSFNNVDSPVWPATLTSIMLSRIRIRKGNVHAYAVPYLMTVKQTLTSQLLAPAWHSYQSSNFPTQQAMAGAKAVEDADMLRQASWETDDDFYRWPAALPIDIVLNDIPTSFLQDLLEDDLEGCEPLDTGKSPRPRISVVSIMPVNPC